MTGWLWFGALGATLCNVDPLLDRGEEAEKAGQIEQAIGLYRKAVECRPGIQIVYTKLALALEKAKRFKEAGDAWWGTLEPWPSDAHAALSAGIAYMEAGEYGLAVGALRYELELRPPDKERLAQFGEAAFYACDCEASAKAFEEARRLGLEHPELGHYLGLCFARLGRAEKAAGELAAAQKNGHAYTKDELAKAIDATTLERLRADAGFAAFEKSLPYGDPPEPLIAPICGRRFATLTRAPKAPVPRPPPKEPERPIATPRGPVPSDRLKFRDGEDLQFRPTKRKVALRPLLERQDEADAIFSPDGKTMISSGIHGVTLKTPGAPKGIRVKVHGAGIQAAFSPDGSRAVVITGGGPPAVISARTGQVELELEGLAATAAFRNERTLLFHTGADSRQLDGALFVVDVEAKGAAPKRIGPLLRTARVSASRDGKSWLVFDEAEGGALVSIDGATGEATPIVSGTQERRISFPIIAPDGERGCYLAGSELECVRLRDRKVEWLSADLHDYEGSFSFDDTGRRMLFVRSETQDQSSYEAVYCVADFDRRTVQRLRGVRLRSGGSVALLSGGRAVASGGAQGAELYDLEARTVTPIRGQRFYSVQGVPGRPRAMVIGKEHPGGTSQDLLLAEVER